MDTVFRPRCSKYGSSSINRSSIHQRGLIFFRGKHQLSAGARPEPVPSNIGNSSIEDLPIKLKAQFRSGASHCNIFPCHQATKRLRPPRKSVTGRARDGALVPQTEENHGI